MTDRQQVQVAIDRIRRRWRARLALEALAGFLTAALAIAVLWALIWWIAGSNQTLASAGRWLALGTLLVVGGSQVWRWSRRRPDDSSVALYVEERAPALNQSLISAVHTLREPESRPGLGERVIAAAQRGLAQIDEGRRLEDPGFKRAGGWVGGMVLGSAALLVFGPGAFREATLTLAAPWRPVAVAPSFLVAVEPGDAEVPRGGAAEIVATLNGFSSEDAELVFRADSAAEWERMPMVPDTAALRFSGRLFDLERHTEYFVEAAGVRSPAYRLTVVDLPAVRRMAATISYPRYTGLAPESIADATDLAVLRGSAVSLRITTTRPAASAALVIEGRAPIAMTAAGSGNWTASFRVTGDAFYRVDLTGDDGRTVTGLAYAIDALDDTPPTVRFSAPGRDTKVTSIEEITAQIEASDDFGVSELSLHVSVNGAQPQVVKLADTAVGALKELSAGHTFFLEEWTLSPGDLVSYHAEATDGAGQTAKSDMYFLEVRPFDKTYREAEQGGSPAAGGGGPQSAEGLSERQRQLVVGTFNVLRDSSGQAAAFVENVTTLAIGQGRLRQDVTQLVSRLQQRGMGAVDSTFNQIGSELDSAATFMQRAEEMLGRRQPRSALPEEQRALQHVQRAEAAYREVMVSMGGQPGGGGGGQQQQRAEELADLFELETDKLRNQYESVERQSEEAAERTLDETLERLRRLASRQEQENERAQRAADALRNRSAQQSGGGGGGGGGSQRQLAQEAEEEARRLERLARERNDQGLADAARRLREAADQMRRAASAGGEQGAAQGSQALERLRNTTRELERSRTNSREEAVRRLQARANELRDRQRESAEQANALPPTSDPGRRNERIGALTARKDALARDVERLEADAERLSRETARDQPSAARKLAEAAQGIRDDRIRDKLAFSKDLLRRAPPDYLKNFEDQISANLDDAAQRLSDAAAALGRSPENRQAQALDRARELVRGLESLNERARAAERNSQRDRTGQRQSGQADAGRSESGQRPDEGRQGQQGQTGQRGAESQSGQRGERGQGTQGGEEARGGEPQTGAPPGQPRITAGRFDNDGTRQFAREFRARRRAADSLRADLRALGVPTEELDRLLDQFRALDDAKTFGDVRGLDRLEEDLIAGLKELEFTLWRRFGAEGEQRPTLGASARVPPRYRELVEEYYRSLARDRPAPKP
jgi:hypothetical protein